MIRLSFHLEELFYQDLEKNMRQILTKKEDMSLQKVKMYKKQLEQIAEDKKTDLNANTIEDACRILEGTAKSMGIEVVE